MLEVHIGDPADLRLDVLPEILNGGRWLRPGDDDLGCITGYEDGSNDDVGWILLYPLV